MNNCQKAVTTMVLRNKALNRGFSLIEMMVVLLIISIILAATAPIAAKKMARDMASGASAWIYTNNNGNIGYNVSGKDISAMIGTTQITNLPNGVRAPRLVLAGDTANPAFVFARRNGEYAGQINMTENQVTMNGLTEGSGSVGANSVAIGMGQTHNGSGGTVAIGQGARVDGDNHDRYWDNENHHFTNQDNIAIGINSHAGAQGTIALGSSAKAFGIHSTAIGLGARANSNDKGTGIQGQNDNGIAIGNGTRAQGGSAIAIGVGASATGTQAIAIGDNASATNTHSIAIGTGVGSGTANEILLGDGSYTVRIPGNLEVWGNISVSNSVYAGKDVSAGANASVKGSLVVDNYAILNRTGGNTAVRLWDAGGIHDDGSLPYLKSYDGSWNCAVVIDGYAKTMKDDWSWSDKRLKNIGEKYTSGLEAIKKLDIYNFTFKNDKNKTPQVGVIAQDLEKVFPNAVTKDVYGYLRIRWDEMFYAVINAVKELDTRVTELSKNVQSYFDETKALKATVAEQQKTIDELKQEIKNQNAEFEKRLAKLEKKK